MLKTLVVYHVKTESTICVDGFCAATIVWRELGDQAEFLKALYHKQIPIETFTDRDVIFVDFSYDVETMDKINDVAKSLIVLDHHMPKASSFEGRSYAVFSSTDSGSTLAWKHFYGNKPIPPMVALIDDGDRALNSLIDVGIFHASLSIEEHSFKTWSLLIDSLQLNTPAYNSFILRGTSIEQSNAAKVKALVKDAFPITLLGIKGLAVNTNKFFGHMVATKLAESSGTFGSAFYVRSDGNVEVSLRRTDPNIDVCEIASAFGGGGHKGAAAFSVSLKKFNELISPSVTNSELLFARIDSATKSFQEILDSATDEDIAHLEEKFLSHLQADLGSNIADYLGFSITKSVSHPSLFVRLLSYVAMSIGLPKTVEKLLWYHKFFPYVVKRELHFDEDSIKHVLLESKPGTTQVNTFFVQRLMDTLDVRYPAELITSIYYIHIVVELPNSPLTIQHTFEVSK